MHDLFTSLLQAIITVAVPIVSAFAIRFLAESTAGAKESRYASEAMDVITTCVAFVSQDYVDALKKDGKFNRDEQKEALRRALMMAEQMLTAGAARFIESAYGDLMAFLKTRIEAEVHLQK